VKQTSNTSLSTAQKTALTDTKMLRANDRAKRTNNNGEQPAVQNTTSKDIQAQLADDRAKRTSSIEQLAVQNQNAEPTAQQADERAGKTNSSPRSMTQNTESKDTQLQNTPPATKPRQTERSEAPANSKPVVAAPTVANASERSGRGVDIEKEAEQSTTPKPSTVDSGLSTDRTKPTVNSSTSAPITTSDSVAVDRRLSTLDSLSHNDAPSKEPVTDKEENDKPPIRSRWNAALVVAPDFSSTGFGGEMSAPGQAFGGMIGYRISRKFTVVGGVIRSSKKYTGYGKDYEPPDGYWQKRTNGVVPDAIKGSCTIIEVPIAVQLDVWQNTRARLYVSGGVSSYFMRHEKYDYSFNEPNEGADRSWGSDIPTSYAFKVGHLSAAYEMMLTKNLGVSVEPYIKIPFQGIGWANLSLYTAGAYVNVRYFLLRKNVE
jgi:hypothetical protein